MHVARHEHEEPAGTPSEQEVETDFSMPADPDLKPVGDADAGEAPEDGSGS